MKEQLAALEKLQQIDSELMGMEVDLNKYPKEISSLQNELEKDKQDISNLEQQLQTIQSDKTQMEQTLEQNNQNIKSTEDRLFEIKTHKEYVALQKEIAESKRANSDIEENILKEMERIEQIEEKLAKLKEDYSVKETEYTERINDQKNKLSELQSAYDPIKAKKDQQSSEIQKEYLQRYERARNKNGSAMALAENERCTGCHMNIPAQLFNEVLKLTKMIQCPNCKRILYTQDVLESEEVSEDN
ncbi:MAG TPA: C4-type zinc ribbon domain-containing protein [Thermodesulfobacteriota bacterium]|nr:C4-type zinc ribbon domain-containing protein [Thermodesulfobacteriota bacterium]